MADFFCKNFGGLTMPADRQRGFCAMQFRKGREICIDCPRGKESAQEEAKEVRDKLPGHDDQHGDANLRRFEPRKAEKKGEAMARVFKKRTCKKHGEHQPTGPTSPCPKCKDDGVKVKKPTGAARGRVAVVKSPAAATDAEQVLRVLLAARIISEAQIDAARKLAGGMA